MMRMFPKKWTQERLGEDEKACFNEPLPSKDSHSSVERIPFFEGFRMEMDEEFPQFQVVSFVEEGL